MQRLSGLNGRLHFPWEALGTAVSRMCPGSAVHLDGAEGTGHTELQSASGCLASQLRHSYNHVAVSAEGNFSREFFFFKKKKISTLQCTSLF